MKHLIIVIMLSLLSLTPAKAYVSNNEETQFSQAENAKNVYVTPRGKRYHYIACQILTRSKEIMTLNTSDYKQSRYSPCKVCTPDLLHLQNNTNASSVASINKHTQEAASSKNSFARSTPSSWNGLCVGVSDGDTITVLRDNKIPVKIRLYGIDTPEKKQAFGMRAKLYTSQLVFQQKVHVQTIDIDRYNREVALITLPDSSLLQIRILEHGMAWVYTKYCKLEFRSAWQASEKKSRNQKIGLWQDDNPIAPWQWRKKKRENAKKKQAKNLKQQSSAQVHFLDSKPHPYILNKKIQTPQIANL